MRSLGYMPNEVELEVIIQRLDMDGELSPCLVPQPSPAGDTRKPSLDPEPPGLSPQGSFHSHHSRQCQAHGSLQLAPFLSWTAEARQSVTAPAIPKKLDTVSLYSKDFSFFWPCCSLWDLSSPTGGSTRPPCSGSKES